MIIAPIVKQIEQQYEEDLVRRSRMQAVEGRQVAAMLELPQVRNFFTDQALEFYNKFLNSPDAELARWRNRALDLNKLYDSLDAAVSVGRAAEESLSKMEEPDNVDFHPV